MNFEGLPNTRDLGGMRTADGRAIRPGKLIRSGALIEARGGDLAKLAELLDTVVDFRTPKECEEKPDPAIPGVVNLHMPVVRTISAGVTREKKTDEEVFARLAMHPDEALRHMSCAYVEFVEREEARQTYARFVRLLMERHERAVLWHCTAGKDRAGFATVILQKLLGVADDVILEDYLLTNTYLKDSYESLIALLKPTIPGLQNCPDDALWTMFSADERYLQAAYDTADRLFGSFDGYLEKGLGFTQADRGTLRAMYLA